MRFFRHLAIATLLCGISFAQNPPNPAPPAITVDASGHLTWWNGSKWVALANSTDILAPAVAQPVAVPPTPQPVSALPPAPFLGAPWLQTVDTAKADPLLTPEWISQFGGTSLHLDFGTSPYGIPANVVNSATDKTVVFTAIAVDNSGEAYPDESDKFPVPLPINPQIEAGSDQHLIVFDAGTGMLYEAYKVTHDASGWHCASLARFDTTKPYSYPLRTFGWTSADAAGMPIYPLLIKTSETGADFGHAMRITMDWMRPAFYANGDGVPAIIEPASHGVSTTNGGESGSPAIMGLRLRLRATFDETPYSGWQLAFVKTAKRYGFLIADVGTRGYISGTTDPSWNVSPPKIALGDLEVVSFDKAYVNATSVYEAGVKPDLAGRVVPYVVTQ